MQADAEADGGEDVTRVAAGDELSSRVAKTA